MEAFSLLCGAAYILLDQHDIKYPFRLLVSEQSPGIMI